MSVTIAQFRQDFPEFASTDTYPDAVVTFWLNISTKLVNPDRWGDLTDMGVELVLAHHLVLAARDQAAASAVNGAPGEVSGPATSEAVGDVSVSRDVASVTIDGGDFWNMSAYGIRFLRLARMIGAGGMQLPACN